MEQGHNRQDNLSLIIQVVLNCENKNRQRNKNKLYKQPLELVDTTREIEMWMKKIWGDKT